jgi:amino acid transporter
MLLQHRAPTSGGQYHWVSEFAPARVERFLSYVVGWLTFTGWQSAITAIGSIVAGAIQGLIALKNPDYGWERWHTTLLTIAVVSFCVFINVFVARRLPLVESFLALVHFAGLFIVIIVLWTLAPRNNAHDAFLQFSNMGGYPTDGLSFMVGLLPLTLCLLGFDSQVHMAEETEDSARSIPRTIMYSTYINAFLGFLMVITLMFTWGDMADIADSAYGWPFLTIFYNTTGSKAATIAMTMLIIFPMTGSVIACVATASRQTWAFARDNGVPFSATVSHVSTKSPSCIFPSTALTRPPLPDLPQIRHPPKRNHRLPNPLRPPLPNQHRLHRRPQRHSRARPHRPARLVQHLHRLSLAQTPKRRAPASPRMVARKSRNGNQYCGSLLVTARFGFHAVP